MQIINWNRDDPWNKSHWHTQHPSLNQFEPPWVHILYLAFKISCFCLTYLAMSTMYTLATGILFSKPWQ